MDATTNRQRSPSKEAGLLPMTWTVNELCFQANISRSFVYELWAKGLGPPFIFLGRRRLISVESARQWLRDLEEQTRLATGDDEAA